MLRAGVTAILLAAYAPQSASACAMATMGKWSAAIDADAVVAGFVVSYERVDRLAFIGLDVGMVLSGDLPEAHPLVVLMYSNFGIPEDIQQIGQPVVVALNRVVLKEGQPESRADMVVAGDTCARKLFFRLDSRRGEALVDMFTSWWPKTLTARSLDRNLSLYILAPD